MNYKLAKKLKDAGFPQYVEGVKNLKSPNRYYMVEGTLEVVDCFNPTLSELIEACGDEIVLVKFKEDNTWCAGTHIDYYADVEGKTPEEVVANLWLSLNKK